MRKSPLNLSALVIGHPVLAYFLLTLLISWGGFVLMAGGPEHISAEPSGAPFLPLYLTTVAGPCMAGILLTGLYYRRNGYRDLFSSSLKWKVDIKWYAAALLIAPLTIFTSLFTLSLFSPVFLPGIFGSGPNPVGSAFGLASADKVSLMFFVLLIGIFNGVVEELGWTGFATPALRAANTMMAAGLQLGVMWGLWHLLANYSGSSEGAGTVPLPLFLAVMLFSFLPPFRIIMMWVYEHTHSLFIAILMHASLDFAWIISMPTVLTGKERILWYLAWALILWLIVLVISKMNKKSSQRKE